MESTSDVRAADCSPAVAPLSALDLDRLASEAFRIGNRGRLALCEALRVLHETRLHLELGHPSIAAYAAARFQLSRPEAYESVRVATSLLELPALRERFATGRLSWSLLKAITRVAGRGTEARWLEFLEAHGPERTHAELRDARRQRRDTPRGGSFGLPNLDQRLVLRLPRSDMHRLRRALERAAEQIRTRTGRQEVATEKALLFLCELDRDAASPAGGEGVDGRDQLVYQCCPDCRRSRLHTDEGFVEVASTDVDRVRGAARQVAIDGPTPPALRRKVLGRDAGVCANPRCDHRADHCHHIVFRSHGGKSELANEVAVCRTCHALIHAGLLAVTGGAGRDLRWIPALDRESAFGSTERGIAASDAERLPVRIVSGVANGAPAAVASAGRESSNEDSGDGSASGLDVAALSDALTRLGFTRRQSAERVARAVRTLTRGPQPAREAARLTDAAVLRAALATGDRAPSSALAP